MSYLTGFPDPTTGAFVYVNPAHVVRVKDRRYDPTRKAHPGKGYTAEVTTCHGGVESVTIVAGKASYVAKTLNRRLEEGPDIEEESTDAG